MAVSRMRAISGVAELLVEKDELSYRLSALDITFALTVLAVFTRTKRRSYTPVPEDTKLIR